MQLFSMVAPGRARPMVLFACSLLAMASARSAFATGQPTDIVCYANAPHGSRFLDVATLSNGSVLVAGTSPDIAWIAPDVPRTQLALPPGVVSNNTGTGKVGFILQLSADLQSIQRVVHFADGAVEDIGKLRFTNVPGAATGSLYISGRNASNVNRGDGYWIARLDNNFVAAAPAAVSWAVMVWAEGDHKAAMPWDVGADGKVVYVQGQPHATGWAAVYRLTAAGTSDIVPQWRTHWVTRPDNTTGEFYGPSASSPNPVQYSGYVLKPLNRGCLRSWTAADYNAWQSDGNGGVRKGTWPGDVYYAGPWDPATPTANQTTRGYTGYRPADSGNTTARCVAVAIDRRNNHIHIGFSHKSVLPDGNPDFEPAVVAFTETGALKWWQRLYREWNGTSTAGTPLNSTPDQYVDALAIDYSEPADSGDLVVVARAHGNNTSNFWSGNAVASAANPTNPGYSFHNGFTGTNGNIHISWVGRFQLSDGDLQFASWNAEYNDTTTGLGASYSDPNLDGWPSHNAGWPNLNTTRLAPGVLATDAQGGVYVLARSGRRTITTANAFQKMVKFGEGSSAWNAYVRVFEDDLTTLRYSSLITGQWNTTTQAGADNTQLEGVAPIADGALVVGWHKSTGTPPVAAGNAIPTRNVVPWGTATPTGEVPIIARLSFSASATPATSSTWRVH